MLLSDIKTFYRLSSNVICALPIEAPWRVWLHDSCRMTHDVRRMTLHTWRMMHDAWRKTWVCPTHTLHCMQFYAHTKVVLSTLAICFKIAKTEKNVGRCSQVNGLPIIIDIYTNALTTSSHMGIPIHAYESQCINHLSLRMSQHWDWTVRSVRRSKY